WSTGRPSCASPSPTPRPAGQAIMARGWRGRRLAVPALTLLLLLAAAPADADSTKTTQDLPPGAPPAAEPGPAPATPPEAAKKAEPAPPKNLETLTPGEAIGLLGKKVRDAAGEDMGMVVDVLVDG